MGLWSVLVSPRRVHRLCVAVALLAAAGLPAAPAIASKEDKLPSILQKKKQAEAPATGHGGSTIVGSATSQTGIVSDQSVSPFLLPDSAAMLQAAADRYATIVANGGWPKVPSGRLKKGATGKAVAALNQRLRIEGYLGEEAVKGELAETYTSATQEAVRRFQINHGLLATGTIDGPTLSQLNVPAERRLATIRANLPRVAEYAKDLGSRYAVVNIPAQQIETVENGRVYSRHNAIVGRPSRPTPVVMTPLTMIRFNPYWNAPASIVEKDIVPRMLSARPSRVMADMNMKIFKGVGGPEIDPDTVDWRRAVVDHYHFRQEPGGSNAMASAKIEFESPFGIYLHDTPEPHLFKSGQRLYSSGCVRVEGVATFIDWVLRGQDGIDRARIAELAQTKERLDTRIADAPQLRVTYLTAWPTRDGMAAFRPDVYDLDGTGFVVGQPMPVGQGGPRFVLKPIPRQVAALEEEEARGFASLFRRGNFDNDSPFARDGRSERKSDALVSTAPAARKAEKTRPAREASAKSRIFFGNPDNAPAAVRNAAESVDGAQKPVKKSDAARKKTADKKTALAAPAKPDSKAKETKAAAARKPVDKSVAARKDDPARKKKADDDRCKAVKDGKLPDGCKAPAAVKKPVAEPAQTAAKAEDKKAAAN